MEPPRNSLIVSFRLERTGNLNQRRGDTLVPDRDGCFDRDWRVPIGWQLLADYHCKVGRVELIDAPTSAIYLPAQLLAKRQRVPRLWQVACISCDGGGDTRVAADDRADARIFANSSGFLGRCQHLCSCKHADTNL